MSESVQKFITYLTVERNSSEHTAAAYMRDIKQFCQLVFDDENFDNFSAVEADHARIFVVKLFEMKTGKSSTARKLSSLRSFFRFLLRRQSLYNNQ